MTDDQKILDKLGEFLMANLRDPAIDFIDMLRAGKWKAPALQSLQAGVMSLPDEAQDLVRRCVVEAIDGAIHDFLFKLVEREDSEADIQMIVDGKNVVPLMG